MEEKKRKGNPRMIKGQVAYPDAPKGGRPKGSVNKMTLLAQQMMTDRGPMIVEKVMGMALQGDVHCLKMCMDRIVPAQKAIEIKHTKSEGGLTINVGTTEQIEEMAKVNKPKRLKTKGDDEVIATIVEDESSPEVLDGDS